MAMVSTAESQILQHPTNPVHQTGYTTGTGKEWARRFKPISGGNLVRHTFVAEDGLSYANFDAFLPLHDDDALRMAEPTFPVKPEEVAIRI